MTIDLTNMDAMFEATKHLDSVSSITRLANTMMTRVELLPMTGQLCGCGDCLDARRAALRTFVQLREGDHCVWWAASLAANLTYLSTMYLVLEKPGMPVDEITITAEEAAKLPEERQAEHIVVYTIARELISLILSAVEQNAGVERENFLQEAAAEFRRLETRKTN